MAKKNSAFMKPVEVSEDLAKIVGSRPQPRTQIVKKLWDYIKKHNLQGCENKRMIEPDECLAAVTGAKSFDMMKLMTRIKPHLFAK